MNTPILSKRSTRWPASGIILSLLVVVPLITAIVFWIDPRRILKEAQLAVIVVGLFLAAMMSICFYFGIRIQREKPPAPPAPRRSASGFGPGDLLELLFNLAEIEYLFLLIILLAGFILIAFGVTVMLALFTGDAAIIGSAGIAAGIYWTLYLCARSTLIAGARYRGRLLPSMLQALWRSLLYTGWLWAILAFIDWAQSQH